MSNLSVFYSICLLYRRNKEISNSCGYVLGCLFLKNIMAREIINIDCSIHLFRGSPLFQSEILPCVLLLVRSIYMQRFHLCACKKHSLRSFLLLERHLIVRFSHFPQGTGGDFFAFAKPDRPKTRLTCSTWTSNYTRRTVSSIGQNNNLIIYI